MAISDLKKAAHAINGKLPLYHSSVSFWEIAIKLSGKGFDFEVTDDWNQIYLEELKRISVPLFITNHRRLPPLAGPAKAPWRSL